MLISYVKSLNLIVRVKEYIYLNNDVLRLIMLESSIDANILFFMTNRYCYNLSKDIHYWKSKFLKHQLPILSLTFHQRYPAHCYRWIQEYKFVSYAMRKTKELWLKNNFTDNYQAAIIGYLRAGDDLSWLPTLFYNQIKCVEEYEYHELHFLIYRNIGTVNYQCYDSDDELITVLSAPLKERESKLLLTSMLYHLPHIIVKIL